MKKIYMLCFASCVLFGCNSQNSIYEKAITDFMENNAFRGVRTDLKIKFHDNITVSDISVADSIAILQKRYEEELSRKIESAQKVVSIRENSITEQEGKGDDIVAKALVGRFSKDLEKAKRELEKAKSWKPDYLNLYTGRNADEIIAKKATCKLSFQDPALSARQEVDGVFILSSDGSKAYKALKSE